MCPRGVNHPVHSKELTTQLPAFLFIMVDCMQIGIHEDKIEYEYF